MRHTHMKSFGGSILLTHYGSPALVKVPLGGFGRLSLTFFHELHLVTFLFLRLTGPSGSSRASAGAADRRFPLSTVFNLEPLNPDSADG